jgi:methyl-accepting chemotaxis protein
MFKKAISAIFSAIALVLIFFSVAVGVGFEKIKGGERYSFVKFDKNADEVQVVQKSFHEFSTAIRRTVNNVTENIGELSTVQSCREQPVLFGALFIFFGSATVSIAFVVHLIRTDLRLS